MSSLIQEMFTGVAIAGLQSFSENTTKVENEYSSLAFWPITRNACTVQASK